MTTSDKHKHAPMTVEQALDELNAVLMDMPEAVLREELAGQGLNYNDLAEEGLKFTQELLEKDRRARKRAQARRFLDGLHKKKPPPTGIGGGG